MKWPLKVFEAEGEMVQEPYLLRLGGWTEERYFAEAPESQIVEFEDGELIMPSPVNLRHQRIVRFLTWLLHGFLEARHRGEVFTGPAVVRLRPGLDYEPNIFVVTTDQAPQIQESYFAGAPALVVEVLSPGGRSYDLQTKAANYRLHQVQEYWTVDPDQRTLFQHTLPLSPEAPYRREAYGSGRVSSVALPGFWIEAGWLWQDPLPDERPLLDEILATSNPNNPAPP